MKKKEGTRPGGGNSGAVRIISEAIKESELRFKAQYQGNPIPTFTWRKRGDDFELTDFNEAAKVISHEKALEFVGRKASDLYANRQDILRDLQRCLVERKVIRRETYSEHFAPGKLITITSVFIPPDLVMVHLEDITERKRAESQKEAALEEVARKAKELQEKNEELTRFTNAVSHDLRSPLVTIKTFLGYLEGDLRVQNQERVEEDFGFIRAAADKMGRLLDELLRLSRVGRMINPAAEAALPSIVKAALDVTAGRITAGGVRVDVTNEPVVLYGDQARLTEIFQNLVDNAAKFMGGQPAPRIEIGVEDVGGETVLFVRDNGVGLDPSFSPRIFGLFEKFDPAADGIGLGLALVRRIVELHGGRIWAESEGLGKGTTIRFTLAKTRRTGGREDGL